MAKEWAKAFYNTDLWKAQREAVLKRDHFHCTEPGCRRTAEEVHHIVELTETNIKNPEIALSMSNLRSLCSVCHKRITKQMHSKGYVELEDIIFDENGYPILANSPPGEGEQKFGI